MKYFEMMKHYLLWCHEYVWVHCTIYKEVLHWVVLRPGRCTHMQSSQGSSAQTHLYGNCHSCSSYGHKEDCLKTAPDLNHLQACLPLTMKPLLSSSWSVNLPLEIMLRTHQLLHWQTTFNIKSDQVIVCHNTFKYFDWWPSRNDHKHTSTLPDDCANLKPVSSQASKMCMSSCHSVAVSSWWRSLLAHTSAVQSCVLGDTSQSSSRVS